MEQPKFRECFNRDFWKDIHYSISFLCRDLILNNPNPNVKISWLVTELKKAGINRVSREAIYAWCDPEKDLLPSLRAFLTVIKLTESCGPLDEINAACGKRTVWEDEFEEVQAAIEVANRLFKRG